MSNKELTSFSGHLDKQYGKKGTPERELYEEEFEAFKLGAMIQDLRKEQGLTQEQLAENLERQKRIFQELKIMQATSGYRI